MLTYDLHFQCVIRRATALKVVFILCEPPEFVCPDNTTFEGTCSQDGLCQYKTSKITTNNTGAFVFSQPGINPLASPADMIPRACHRPPPLQRDRCCAYYGST